MAIVSKQRGPTLSVTMSADNARTKTTAEVRTYTERAEVALYVFSCVTADVNT